MRTHYNLPQFKKIDDQLKSIGDLANYDPLLTVVRQRFQAEVTNHLTSLKSRNKPSVADLNAQTIRVRKVVKEAYMSAGKEYAVSQYFFDMTKRTINKRSIQCLADILCGESEFRTKEILISNVSGDQQSTPPPKEIEAKLDGLIQRFNSRARRRKRHAITLATELHYGFTHIHPFSDWNGRIARLLLNVALIKLGCLPILIGKDERNTYYENLEAADKGDLLPLIGFIADKQLETIDGFTHSAEYLSIQGKYELEERLQEVGENEKCLVLTEDSTTNNLLSVILEASGFKMNETKLISYEGCSKIASANLFSIFVKEKMPNVHILVHRDRDYLTEHEIEQQHETFHRIDVRFFVTDGTDIESHFVNAPHVHQCHPQIDIHTANALVEDTINEVLPKSTDYLYKKEFGNRKVTSTHLSHALNDLVEQNRFRFTHGKTALRILERRVNNCIKEKAKLQRPTKAIKHPQLSAIAKRIWK